MCCMWSRQIIGTEAESDDVSHRHVRCQLSWERTIKQLSIDYVSYSD